MKRKPNKPRPEAQTHTEPVNGAAEPEGSAFGAGSEQESGAAGTSGQSVPKSKFRQKSNQEKAAASKLRMEKRGEKLDRAKEKLAKELDGTTGRNIEIKNCPVCGQPLKKRNGRFGEFWGCMGFPTCRYTENI